MKTTLELSDAVFERARSHAQRRGLTLRSLVEEALRRHLDSLDSAAAPRRALQVKPWGRGGFLPGYEQRSWNEIMNEVNARPVPDDRG